jgi:acetyl esterase/lipase
MKANGQRHGVDPERIVLCGASAGGQIALLAAYSPNDPELTPPDLQNQDTPVHGVVSYYGPADMRPISSMMPENLRAPEYAPSKRWH